MEILTGLTPKSGKCSNRKRIPGMLHFIQTEDQTLQINDVGGVDISIPLHFDEPQPNAFGVDSATATTLGDTRSGSSVNFEQYNFIPHCNGTHTECVGHITDERISVGDCLRDVFMLATLISVEPAVIDGDLVIGVRELHQAFEALTEMRGNDTKALIVRTLPNDDSKLTRIYGDDIPPYFSTEAMEFIVDRGFKHLLVDMPSIDRIFDEGKLTNHRMFWNVEQGSREVNAATRRESTITELIYVPNTVADGEYLLNLQIAPFVSDATPSRPVLFKSEPPA